jgi:precorrin-2 dehydrogenase / sirohydrochlorin ferrochelatase
MNKNNYLPVILDLGTKKILLVGGGAIAVEKLSRLVDCTNDIVIVASQCSSQMQEYVQKYSLTLHLRLFEDSDLDGVDIVIAAIDSLELQSDIFTKATARKILCNAVDLPAYCHFIFPSIIRKDDLIVAISTSGASPAAAKYLKRFFERLIPDNIGEFLTMMREKRSSLPKGKERMRLLDGLASGYMRTMSEYAKGALKSDMTRAKD